MSTLEIACANCGKKFRVRAEFAGRSTRCPACSAPITVGGTTAPIPSKPAAEERPRSKPRRRDNDDEDDPLQPSVNWTATELALRREQIALIFVFLSILGGFFIACISSMARPLAAMDGPMPIVFILFGVSPALTAMAFGLMARISALGVPRESQARGSAVASLLCSIAGLVFLAGFGLSLLMNMESGRPNELPMVVSGGGLVIAGLASFLTFVGYTAQVGIFRKSAAVSRGVGRMGIAVATCSLIILAIGVLYAFYSEVSRPTYYTNSYGRGYYYDNHGPFYSVVTGILMPISFGIVLIFYHRLLGAARNSISAQPSRRYND